MPVAYPCPVPNGDNPQTAPDIARCPLGEGGRPLLPLASHHPASLPREPLPWMQAAIFQSGALFTENPWALRQALGTQQTPDPPTLWGLHDFKKKSPESEYYSLCGPRGKIEDIMRISI